jgi:hypothetical protein
LPPSIQILSAQDVTELGTVDASVFIADLRASLVHRATAIDDGLFTMEAEREFDHTTYFDDVESWLAYRAEHGSKRTSVAPELVARARALLSQREGRVAIVERASAARLRKPAMSGG